MPIMHSPTASRIPFLPVELKRKLRPLFARLLRLLPVGRHLQNHSGAGPGPVPRCRLASTTSALLIVRRRPSRVE